MVTVPASLGSGQLSSGFQSLLRRQISDAPPAVKNDYTTAGPGISSVRSDTGTYCSADRGDDGCRYRMGDGWPVQGYRHGTG